MSERYQFIEVEKANHPVTLLCKLLGVSRSGYYAQQKRPPSRRSQVDSVLLEKIKQIHQDSRCTYGAPRIQVLLQREGIYIGRKRVARLMREACLTGRYRKRRHYYPKTSEVRDTYPGNVPARDFKPLGPNRLWLTDVTYLPTREGWTYLAVVIDCWSRKIVGYHLSDKVNAELCLVALEKAVAARGVPTGLVHHSDRGAT